MIAACEDASNHARLLHLDPNSGLKIDLDPNFRPRGPLHFGIDVGRDHDATCGWLDEQIGDVAVTRGVFWLHGITFPNQGRLLNPILNMCVRGAIDKTGMGSGLYDILSETNAGRLMGVSFSGTNDNGVKMKTDLAIRIKKRFEQARVRLPYDPQIRTELQAIKRQATSTGVTFDAPRIEVDTAVAGGVKKKVFAHADAFWAKALADLAADSGFCQLDGVKVPGTESTASQTKGFN